MNQNFRVISFFAFLSLISLLAGCASPAENTPAATPAATQNLSVEANPAAGGPQIVGQIPLKAERLALSGSIQLVFDREMNKEKTAAAWTVSDAVGKPVSGTVSWKDARTLIFQPAAKLRPSTTYTGALAPLAVAVDGTSPEAVVKLLFQTVDALAIGQVFPADKAQDIEVGANITVIFNRPIVPLNIKEEQSKLPQPLKIVPEVKGSGEWLNSSVYIFQPEQPLNSGAEYQVSVAAGLTDTIGNKLDQDYSWKFNTRAPEISNFSLLNGTYEMKMVPLDQAFVVDFLQPMDAASVTKALTLLNRETKKPFPTKLTWNAEFTQLVITPVGRYTVGSFYDVNLIASVARAKSGGALKSGLAVQFSTVPLPAIKSVRPLPDSKGTDFYSSMTIAFTAPMKFDSLKGKVKITPPLDNASEPYYDEAQMQLHMNGLAAATDYVVRILPGMTDIYGNAIKTEYSFSFKTGNVSANAYMLFSWTPLVYRPNGEQAFFFQHTNLTSANFSLYRLTFDEFHARITSQDKGVVSPDSKPIREWQPGLLQVPNKQITEKIKLQDEKGNALPAGYYYIGLKAKPLNYSTPFYQGAVFAVATDNITLKTSPTEALAWVVDLEKGLPVADVQVVFYDNLSAEVGRAKTDEKGLAYLKGLKSPYMAQLDDAVHVAIASSDWGSGVSPYDFGIWQSWYDASLPDQPFGYTYTERPLYRPGQDVFFKGIVRQNDDLHYSLPTQDDVYVTIEQAGEQIYAETLPLSKMGTFTGTLKLGEQVALGTYEIVVRNKKGDESAFSYTSFRVAEYHKPEFQVNIVADPASVLVGDNLKFTLDATYYAGGGVSKAGVEWFTNATPYFFQPGAKYNQFSFIDWDRDTYYLAPGPTNYNPGDYEAKTETTVTDEKGHLELPQVASLGQSTVSQQVSFSANVTDAGGNLVSGSSSVIVHQSLVYAGIRSEAYVGKAGKEQAFELAALNWDSSPVAGQTLTVDFVQREWLSVQEQDKQSGQLRWVSSVKETPIQKNISVVTDADGKAKVAFTPPTGGTFKATVTVKDAKGNTQQASTYIWVSGDGYIAWRQSNDRSFSLIADKDSYKPGDTAEIMIAQPFKNDVYALITFERGHIYQKEVVLLKGNSTVYKLPITKDMAPVSYISVVVVSGAQDAKAPDFKMGLARITVDTSEQELDVTVSADKQSAGPGQDVTYTVQTKDKQGNPVSAEISLSVVDKAVLALAPSNSVPLLDAFYSEQGLAVTTAVGIVMNAEDFNANFQETVSDGAGAGGGGAGDLGIITVRQNFKDTAFFTAQVMTDENGQAQVKVTLPENLTTWVVDVRAVTDDTRVGQVTGDLVSTKPLFIEMQTPRFFVVGDAAQVGAVIHNNGDTPLKVDVALEAGGADLKSPASQTVDVPAKQQAYVTWDVLVRKGVRRVDFTASAKSGSLSDSSKPALGTLSGQGIPVYEYNVPETVGTSGLLTDANSVTESIQLPQTMGSSNTILSVEMAPSLAASMKNGLTFLEDFSYLCIEQTVSRFLPNVVSSRALKLAGGPTLTLQKDLDANVGTALQRLYSKQLGDGGWGWWDSQTSDLQTSAYVMLGLKEAQAAGYTVSSDVMERGLQYLQNNQVVVGANEASWKHNRQAFILYVYTRYGEKPQTGFIFEQRHALSLYGKAYLAQAIYNIDPKDKRIATLMSDLSSAAALSAAGAHWEEGETDYWNWNTDLRTTAIVLDTFIKIDPKNPITANAVRWLMSNRTNGHWASTQETTWTLIALTDWLVESKEYETNYPFAIGLNGNKLQEGLASKASLTETVKLEVGLKDLLVDQVNQLVLTRGEGTGNLYYSAYLTTSLPVEDIQPLDQGMVVSRQYFDPTDPKTPITEIKRGELVRVRLTVVLPQSAHYIVVDDPLPAGFEAVDVTIATDAKAPSSYTRQDFDERGWGWWYFSHVEMRDEKVVLSTDYLPAGTYVYTYLARASTAGTFKVIPPHAAQFYFPDVGGRGAGSIFVVK